MPCNIVLRNIASLEFLVQALGTIAAMPGWPNFVWSKDERIGVFMPLLYQVGPDVQLLIQWLGCMWGLSFSTDLAKSVIEVALTDYYPPTHVSTQ